MGPIKGQQQQTIGKITPRTEGTFVLRCEPTPLKAGGSEPEPTYVVWISGVWPVADGKGEPESPSAGLNSSKVASAFHAPSSKRTIVCALARPWEIHSRSVSRV